MSVSNSLQTSGIQNDRHDVRYIVCSDYRISRNLPIYMASTPIETDSDTTRNSRSTNLFIYQAFNFWMQLNMVLNCLNKRKVQCRITWYIGRIQQESFQFPFKKIGVGVIWMSGLTDGGTEGRTAGRTDAPIEETEGRHRRWTNDGRTTDLFSQFQEQTYLSHVIVIFCNW